MGCRVQGSGSRVQGSGLRVEGSGHMVQGLEFMAGRFSGAHFRYDESSKNLQGDPTSLVPLCFWACRDLRQISLQGMGILVR